MADENTINLDPEQIENHYNSIVSSANNVVLASVTEDTYTNITVKNDASSAYSFALELENMLKTCILYDASNLNSLGADFIGNDNDASNKIALMLDGN